MLIKLTGEQISRHWESFIKDCIRNSVPLIAGCEQEQLNGILASLLSFNIECWAVKDGRELVGLATTQLTVEPISNTRSMLIYSFYAIKGTPDEVYANCYEQMTKYAGSLGCNRLYCYTSNPRILEMAKMLGAEEQVLLAFPPIHKNC